MSKKTLVPQEEKRVLFYEDVLTAVRVDNTVYVPVRPIIEQLGLDWSGQRQRIHRDAVLSQEVTTIIVSNPERTDSEDTASTIASREMLCLPLDFLSGFLFGINANRVREEFRERVIRYQRECYKVLAEAFKEGRLTADPTFDELIQYDSPAVQAYKMAQAVMTLARQQILMESRLDSQDERLADHERRLEEVEAQLGDPDHFITQAQASRISQAVRAIGLVLTKRSGRNEYGAVYGELYRRYEISSYRELPASKYEDAMAWLNQWRQSLVDDVEF